MQLSADETLLFLRLPSVPALRVRGEPFYRSITPEDQAVVQGESVFMAYCHTCHPGGESGLGPAINNKPLPGFMIRFQVRNGVGAMPAFKRDVISKDEMDDLVAYLKVLRKALAGEPACLPKINFNLP